MTDWRATYERRLVSAADAATQISPGDHVYVPVGQQPQAVIRAFLERDDGVRNVTITCLPAVDYGWFAPEHRERLTVNVLYANATTRGPVAEGVADYTPFMIFGGHKALDDGREEARPIDVAIVTVTPPNEHGYVCFGHALWDAKSTVGRARRTIAVINDHLPRTYGDTWLHSTEFDWFIEDHQAPRDRETLPPDPWDEAIAGYAGSLVRDGDTIQIGVGSTTGNMIQFGALAGRQELGYFGELTVPGTVDLVRQGVITGRRLGTHPGKFVATTAGNSVADRAYMNGNPGFEFYGVEYIHDPASIAANPNYVAINNAIAVDLTGQIAASTIGPAVYSGTGGHLSFAMGAFMSRGGRYICVLPATARGGTVSRIVPQFESGQIVTVPRDIADTVVTEYGIARLLNRTVRERAEALIAVAHPDFRTELRREMGRLFRA